MKKYSMFLAMAALVSAMSCSKEVDSPENVNTAVEKEVITVRLSSPATKTALEGTKTVWLEGDKVSVTVGGKQIGELELVEGDFFKGEVEAGHEGEAILNYPSGVTAVPTTQVAIAGTFANEAALLEGSISMNDLRAGKNAELVNRTALLHFSVAQAGDVTFKVGSTTYTVTGCKTGETYYLCVAPVANVDFKAIYDGYTIKEASNPVTFVENKIVMLGTLPYNVYLHAKTARYDWTKDNARFASWTWGGEEDCWIDFIKDEDHEGVYRIEIPQGYTGAKFCRMQPDTDNGWGSQKWNETGDLVLPTDTKNHFYIKSANDGEWGEKEHQLPSLIAFELNTDNSKKYWGEDAYLYIEKGSEKPLGTWPGTKMKKVGTHRWEYEIPAKLRGVSCYYQIHNNGGWIGKKTLTINSYDYTFWGSDMGVN